MLRGKRQKNFKLNNNNKQQYKQLQCNSWTDSDLKLLVVLCAVCFCVVWRINVCILINPSDLPHPSPKLFYSFCVAGDQTLLLRRVLTAWFNDTFTYVWLSQSHFLGYSIMRNEVDLNLTNLCTRWCLERFHIRFEQMFVGKNRLSFSQKLRPFTLFNLFSQWLIKIEG